MTEPVMKPGFDAFARPLFTRPRAGEERPRASKAVVSCGEIGMSVLTAPA